MRSWSLSRMTGRRRPFPALPNAGPESKRPRHSPVCRRWLINPSACHEYEINHCLSIMHELADMWPPKCESGMVLWKSRRAETVRSASKGGERRRTGARSMVWPARFGKRVRDGLLAILGVAALGLAAFFALHEPRGATRPTADDRRAGRGNTAPDRPGAAAGGGPACARDRAATDGRLGGGPPGRGVRTGRCGLGAGWARHGRPSGPPSGGGAARRTASFVSQGGDPSRGRPQPRRAAR